MYMFRVDIVLGHEWLHRLGPSLKCSFQHNTLSFDAHGVHVLLVGGQDVLTSPMICYARLHSIINKEEINSLVLCYLMPPSLFTNVCVRSVFNYQSEYDASSCTSPPQ